MKLFRCCALLGAVCVGALSGCGKNAVIKEDAAKLSAEMSEVVAESRQFYKLQAAARADFLIRLLAQGEYCSYTVPAQLVLVPNERVRCVAPEEAISLPVSGQPPKQPQPLPAGATTYTVDLFDAPQQSALQTIAVIADFQSVVAKIVEDPAIDSAAELQMVVDRACTLSARLTKLGEAGLKQCEPGEGQKEPDTVKIFADERDALSAVVDLARKAMQDSKDVAQLRTAYTKHGNTLSAALKNLLSRYEEKDRKLKLALDADTEIAARRSINRQLAELKRIESGPRKGELNDDGRYKLMTDQYAKEALLRTSGDAPDPLAAALGGLIKTDAAFQAALLEGKLTTEMRARIAKSTFDQLKAWFRALRTLTTVF